MKLLVLFIICPLLAFAAESQSKSAMSLHDCVQYALEHSPDLKSAQTEIFRRKGIETSVRAGLLPQLDISGDTVRTRYNRGYPQGISPLDARFDKGEYNGTADLKMMAWDFKKTALELDAARQKVQASQASVDSRRQQIIFDTARLYLQSMAYTDLIQASEARINSMRSLLDRTNKLVEGGRAVPVDALKIQTRLALVENDLATLKSERISSLSQLASVMGYEGDLPVLLYSPSSSSSDLSAGDLDEHILIKEAEINRPDLESISCEVHANEQTDKAAGRALLPKIDLRAQAVQYGLLAPTGFQQLMGTKNATSPSRTASDWTLGAHISFPLFDGGQRRGKIQESHAQLTETRLAKQQLQLRVSREVRIAIADVESAQSRVQTLRDTVAESERVLHDEEVKYGAGRSVINFVLDAESALLINQSLLFQAQRSIATATLELELSTGKLDSSKLP